jgi:hypothetical protein
MKKDEPKSNKKSKLDIKPFAKSKQEAESILDTERINNLNKTQAQKKKEAAKKESDSLWNSLERNKRHSLETSEIFEGKPTGKGALEPSYPELMLMPGSLPFKATSKIGKAAVGVAEALNPIGGMRGFKPNITSSVDDVGKGFKSEIDWKKWNKEIPKNKALIQEYNAIEQQAKANGTWMKNPDGSTFQGTPEQFVQQNSENFKKAFPNPIRDENGNIQINYHGQREGKPFSIFKPSTRGAHGVGNYTFAGNREGALKYTNNEEKRLYSLYINSNNPQKTIESVFSPEFNVKTGRLQEGYDYLKVGEEQVTPIHNFLKSAVGNNGMFDMTNPNIYKSLLLGAIGAGGLGPASQIEQKQNGGYLNNQDMKRKKSKYKLGGDIPSEYNISNQTQYAPDMNWFNNSNSLPSAEMNTVGYSGDGNKKREPIYVDDLKDPRLIAYQDSSDLYKLYKYQELLTGNTGKSIDVNAKILNSSDIHKDAREALGFNFWGGSPVSHKQVTDYEKNTGKPGYLNTDIEEYKKLSNLNKNNNITIIKRDSPEFYHKSIEPVGNYKSQKGAANFIYKEPVQPVIYQKKNNILSSNIQKDYWDTDPMVLLFRQIFKQRFGEEPSRDPKIAKYDYDKAYKSGVRPVLDPEDGLYHWDSKFKADDHPNRFVDGMDTKTGRRKIEPMQSLGTQQLDVQTPNELMKQPEPQVKGTKQNYSANPLILERMNLKKGYTNEGKNLGREEFDMGGALNFYNTQIDRENEMLQKGFKFLTDTGLKLAKAGVFEMGGDLTHYQGNSHENGGIPVGQNAEVEGGETNHQGYIFSDTLKLGKKTFAQLSKEIEKKHSKRPDDKISKSAKERELNNLMQIQESTGMTNSSNKYKLGGRMKYRNAGFLPTLDGLPINKEFLPTPDGKEPFTAVDNMEDPFEFQRNYAINKNVDNMIDEMNTSKEPEPYKMDQISPLWAIGSNLGNLFNLGLAAGNKDVANLQRVKPNLVNTSSMNRLAAKELRDNLSSTSNAIRNTATTAGSYLSNEVTSRARGNNVLGEYLAKTGLANEQINNQVLNTTEGINANIQAQEQDLNQRNKDARRSVASNAISNIGNNIMDYGRDRASVNQTNAMSGLTAPTGYTWTEDKNGQLQLTKKLTSRTQAGAITPTQALNR